MSTQFGSTIVDRESKSGGSKFRKTEFLNMKEGEHLIRILEHVETKKTAHYVGWAWLECLGDECPICENNKRIMYEHPDDFRDITGWNPRRDRYFINVLDKSVGDDGQPVNAVKVLSRGPTLFEDLSMIANAIRNADGNVVDVTTYDFTLIVKGQGRDTTVSVIPRWIPGQENNPVYEGELFDLDKALIRLEPDEMIDALNGTSVKDIFAMRRAKKEVLQSDAVLNSDNLEEEITASVDEIFKVD